MNKNEFLNINRAFLPELNKKKAELIVKIGELESELKKINERIERIEENNG